MSLRDQYQFLFNVTYDNALRERFLSQPQNLLKEQGLAEEFRPLTQGRINRIRVESLARRGAYLKTFFSCFPKTTFVLTSACRSLEPLSSFFASPHFLNCFSSNESFVDAFNSFLAQQVRRYTSKVPSLPDLHSYEAALYLLRTRPHDEGGLTREVPMDLTRCLVQAPHALLRRFTYPITEIVEYIDYFTASSWYHLAPLYAAVDECMPTLVIPHEALSDPLLALLTLQGKELRVLKIKASQYDVLAGCDGTRSCHQLLEAVESADLPRLTAWLDYCWQKRILDYFEE